MIERLRITHANVAIDAENSPGTKVIGTEIDASTNGIYFYQSDGSEASFNTIKSVDYGIFAAGVTRLKIESNQVTNARQIGIYLGGVTGAGLIGARVRFNITNSGGIGINLYSTTNTIISNNTAKNNSTAGVFVDSASTNNSLQSNRLQHNGTDAIDDSSGSMTAGTANSWSNNTCTTSTPTGLCK